MATLIYAQTSPTYEMKCNSSDENLSGNTATPTTTNTSTSSQLTKTFSKITVQNVLSENNANTLNISNNNAIVRKIKEFGMFGNLGTKRAVNNSKNEPPPIKTILLETKKPRVTKDMPATPKTAKKTKTNTVAGKPAGTPGRKGLPLPQAVARRNARERNRVKQVNNGFAALRERIPEEVAEAFETHSATRSSVKKLSKVETLRMAVEYIRSLERLLGFDFPTSMGDNMLLNSMCTSSSDSNPQSSPGQAEHDFSLIKDEFDAISPQLDEPFDDSLSNYDVDDYFTNSSGNNSEPMADNLIDPHQPLPNITSLNGLQYIRIPGTNTYQLLTDNLFVNNNNNNSNEDERLPECSSPSATTMILAAAEAHLITAPASATNCNGTTGLALSRSPVPQATSSPHQARDKCMQPALLSPAANELLLQTCAAQSQQQQQQQLAIKQEYGESGDYKSTLIYQSAASQLLHPITLAISPPLENQSLGCTLPPFFRTQQSFQKKQTVDGNLLGENLMESIDWWDAHTPKSDNSSTH